MPTSLLCSLVLLALPAPSHGARAVPAVRATPARTVVPDATPARTVVPDWTSEIRQSIRWLRTAQDPASGLYSGGLDATSLAVLAFTECPDHYRAVDGPFVRLALQALVAAQRADGAIATSDDPAAVQRSSTLAEAALARGDGGHAEPLARVRAWLAAHPERPADTAFPYGVDLGRADMGQGDAAVQAAQALGAKLIAERDGAGFWPGPRGKVVETATRVLVLSHLAALATPAASAGHAKAPAIEPLPGFSPADRERAQAALSKGAAFLVSSSDEQGRFGAPGAPDAGLTAMALSALGSLPAPRDPAAQRKLDAGLAWLASLQHEDGSIHDGKLANYITSASIQALASSGNEAWRPAIARARAFLERLQCDEGEGYSEGDLYYGGIGYGSTERPDLSNLQMALEALASAGAASDSETYTKALKFLERCQNRSESNDTKLVSAGVVTHSGDDGGAAYAPGDSKAGSFELADGTRVPRSYGSMTYALLKCYLFAGMKKDDARLQAAWNWCRSNYTLDVNPGFQASVDPSAAYQGLFYYFATMSRALDLFGEERIATPDGSEHAWRAELSGRLVAMQSKLDGSWTNRNSPRWYEGNPVLATSYALLALEAALPDGVHDAR